MTRSTLTAAAAVLAMAAGSTGALAQTTNPSGWSFNVEPYLWLPKVSGTFNYQLPGDVGGSATVDSNPSNYLSGLNFAGMLAGEARYQRFSVLADMMYINISNSSSHLHTGNFAAVPSNPITGTADLNTSTRVAAGIWSLAGGYTVLEGGWGNLDVLAGVRVVTISAKTNYYGSIVFTGPRGNTATVFGPGGGLSVSEDLWNGIAGLRGKIRIPNSAFFVPFYADVGGGASSPTWQVSTGLGYQTGLADLSIGWRYLGFDQGSSGPVKTFSLNGPYFAAAFKF
jgi:hypothetical protein